MFKSGDKVTLVRVNDQKYHRTVERLFGKVLIVTSVGNDRNGDEIVLAGLPGEGGLLWYANDLRLATKEEIAAAQKPRKLRRGDLVVLNGEIGVVHETDPDEDAGYWVAALTGDGGCVWRCAEDLTRIGSIRKKIKRIKKEMENSK